MGGQGWSGKERADSIRGEGRGRAGDLLFVGSGVHHTAVTILTSFRLNPIIPSGLRVVLVVRLPWLRLVGACC